MRKNEEARAWKARTICGRRGRVRESKNEAIRWYCGDTFDLELHIDLTDRDRKPVSIPRRAR